MKHHEVKFSLYQLSFSPVTAYTASSARWSHTCDTSLIILETPGNEPKNSSKIYHFLPKF